VPAFIAPEGFEAQEGIVADGAPELTGTFEVALALPAGRLHRTLQIGSPAGGAVR
jgi:hypothetical protein